MKTRGGYEITEFTQLAESIDRGGLKLVYKGMIKDPNFPNKIEVYWDEEGKCTNSAREDCFLQIDIGL